MALRLAPPTTMSTLSQVAVLVERPPEWHWVTLTSRDAIDAGVTYSQLWICAWHLNGLGSRQVRWQLAKQRPGTALAITSVSKTFDPHTAWIGSLFLHDNLKWFDLEKGDSNSLGPGSKPEFDTAHVETRKQETDWEKGAQGRNDKGHGKRCCIAIDIGSWWLWHGEEWRLMYVDVIFKSSLNKLGITPPWSRTAGAWRPACGDSTTKNGDHEKRQSTCAVADFAAWFMTLWICMNLLNKKVDAFVARVITRPVISSNPSAAECTQWTCFLCLSGQLAQSLGQGLGPFWSCQSQIPTQHFLAFKFCN